MKAIFRLRLLFLALAVFFVFSGKADAITWDDGGGRLWTTGISNGTPFDFVDTKGVTRPVQSFAPGDQVQVACMDVIGICLNWAVQPGILNWAGNDDWGVPGSNYSLVAVWMGTLTSGGGINMPGTCPYSVTAPSGAGIHSIIMEGCTTNSGPFGSNVITSCGNAILDFYVNPSQPPQCAANAGQSCTTSNACGSNSGTINCSATCSAPAPAIPANYGNTCPSPANACGQTRSGTIECDGISCTATVAPPNPAFLGIACTSAENACGMTNPGTRNCSNVCTATVPSNALCPDITIDAVSRPPGPVIKGSAVTFTARERNQIRPTTVNNWVRFCLNNTDCLTNNTNMVGSLQRVDPLGIGGTSIESVIWPSAIVGGPYTLRVCGDAIRNPADPNGEISESNEGNNCANLLPFTVFPECSDGIDNDDTEDIVADAVDIGCRDANGNFDPNDDDETNPNLTITAFTIPNGAPLERVLAHVTIYNAGTAPTPLGNFEIAINRDLATLAVTGGVMDTNSLEDAVAVESVLLAGASRDVKIWVILPGVAGSYTATAMVDSDDGILETNELDNTRRSPTYTVTAPLPQPNLTITGFTIPNGIPGQQVPVSISVRNEGNGAATNFIVAINNPASTIGCRGAQIWTSLPITLAAGASRTFTPLITLPLPPNTYTAAAMVDYTCVITETDESDLDNKSTATYVVAAIPPAPLPNLTITLLDVPDGIPGQIVPAKVRIHNAGNADTPRVFDIAINNNRPTGTLGYGDPVTRTKTGVLSLAAGASRDETIQLPLPGTNGPYTAVALVDSTRLIAEMDDNDNTLSDGFIVVTPRPNLKITDFNIPNGPPGTTVAATVTILNELFNGVTAVTAPSFEVAIDKDTPTLTCADTDPAIVRQIAPALPGGASESVTINVLLGIAGPYSATALANSRCTVAETTLLDNSRNTNYVVTSTVPLASSSLVGNPKQVQKGKTAVLTVNATNVLSCRLSGDNGESWPIPVTGENITNITRITKPLFGQTRFLLECNDLSNAPITPKSVTIKLVPSFREF